MLSVQPTPPTSQSIRSDTDADLPVCHRLEHLALRHSQVESEEECRRIARFLVAVVPGVRLATWDDSRDMVGMVEEFMEETAVS
ncbi:hypothetical protein PsYK624_112080 [Phanerochaete sordida]|uniref:Uncharacterized protein n=1 Tax=Phanerochaete sordida TaxID=48140 RepID=A0A9P3GK79_9APHY|nr:hypothetical protein PsYK624_112080 [Phanerochaete sordida]